MLWVYNYLISFTASIATYFVCKWLERNDKND